MFGVSQRRSGTIRTRLKAHNIDVVSAQRMANLTYLEFKSDADHTKAVKLIYRWYESEFNDNHWTSQ